MSLIKVVDQIQNWKSKSTEPGDYWEQIAGWLAEFQQLSGVEKYHSEDSEGFIEAENYADLLKVLADLVFPEFEISKNINFEEGDFWKWQFEINGKPEIIGIENLGSDWFDLEFLSKLNAVLRRHGSQKKFRMVFASSEMNADQCFDMVFISDEIYQKLADHSPKYAE